MRNNITAVSAKTSHNATTSNERINAAQEMAQTATLTKGRNNYVVIVRKSALVDLHVAKKQNADQVLEYRENGKIYICLVISKYEFHNKKTWTPKERANNIASNLAKISSSSKVTTVEIESDPVKAIKRTSGYTNTGANYAAA